MLVVDPDGGHWVKFVVRRIPPTNDKPHGLNYSLTLHDENGARLVGFDNAHPVRSGSGPGGTRGPNDHKHRLRTIKAYEYRSAADLLADFWTEVDGVLKERGVLR
ncbi:MAG: hypothetical protein HY985_09770 [Magnetospirillum sp.]|nr:hypothetical protein [Magnetospirillum sp.]